MDADLTRVKLTSPDFRARDIPIIPAIDAKIEDAINAGGTLDMYLWHGCGSTHCRAGWAIYLAGAKGKALEARYGPEVAGILIYDVSRPAVTFAPDFFASDADAWADIQKCAAEQRIEFPGYRKDGATGANPDKNSA